MARFVLSLLACTPHPTPSSLPTTSAEGHVLGIIASRPRHGVTGQHARVIRLAAHHVVAVAEVCSGLGGEGCRCAILHTDDGLWLAGEIGCAERVDVVERRLFGARLAGDNGGREDGHHRRGEDE